ncbi:hypothetical protein OSTOST_23115, partial [Ostertagia ostertagi]
ATTNGELPDTTTSNRNSIKHTSDLDTEDSPIEAVNDIDSDDESKVVHEEIRNPAMREFHFRCETTFEENELIATLCNLMDIRIIDTSNPSWFQELQE